MKNYTYCCDSCIDLFSFTSDDKEFICPICGEILSYCSTEEIDPATGKVVNSYQESIRKNANPSKPIIKPSQPSKPTVTCPYCQSTNTKKISGTSRFMSTGIFGLASGKIGKQWHCNNCKSDF